jgi:hypothetical protein
MSYYCVHACLCARVLVFVHACDGTAACDLSHVSQQFDVACANIAILDRSSVEPRTFRKSVCVRVIVLMGCCASLVLVVQAVLTVCLACASCQQQHAPQSQES